jgi:hypothetical protein
MRKFYLFFLCFALVSTGYFSFSVQSNDFLREGNSVGVYSPEFNILPVSYHTVHFAVCCPDQPVAFQKCVFDVSLFSTFKCNFSEPGVYASMRYPVSRCFPEIKSGMYLAHQADALPFFVSKERFRVGDFYTDRIFTVKHESGINSMLMNWTVSLFEGMLEIYSEKGSTIEVLAFELRGEQPANIVHSNDPNASGYRMAA